MNCKTNASAPSGGGVVPTGDYRVRFWDYDGTLLKTEYVNHGENAEPPTVPEHALLDFQEWNESYENITHDTEVGAIYITKEVTIDGWTGRPTIIKGTATLKTGTTTSIKVQAVTLSTTIRIAKKVGETYEIIKEQSIGTSETDMSFDIGGYGDFELYIYSPNSREYSFSSYAFYENYMFQYLHLGDYPDIGYGNFRHSYGLEYISVPSNVLQLTGQEAFWECRKLKAVVLPQGAGISNLGSLCENCYSLKLFLAPSLTSTTSRNYAFQYCYSLETVYMPLIEVMGNFAFQYCYSLETVYMPLIEVMGTYAFNEARNMKEIVCPAQASIGSYFARNATNLEKVNIHENTTSIGGYAFSGCTNLMKVIINRAVFNEEALTVSASLTVTTLETILGYDSETTRGVISVYLGDTLVDPSNYSATANNTITFTTGVVENDIVTVKYMRSITTLSNANAFSGINQLAKIYVPDYAVDVYKNYTNWITYKDYIYPLSELEE